MSAQDEALALLTATRAGLTDPRHWTRHAPARGDDGRPIRVESEGARCWCLMGYLTREYRVQHRSSDGMRRAHELLIDALPPPWRVLPTWQDTVTHPDVLALLDRALQAARAREG